MVELTGILPGGAKMKADILEDTVVFRGAFKAEVPFEEIVAEARGTLLVLSARGHVVELGAGARASQLAARIRSPPSRLDRLGVQYGASAAVAGPFDAAFKAELGSRALVSPGLPGTPVDLLFLAVAAPATLEAVPKLAPLVAPGGSLWVVHPKGAAAASRLAAVTRAAGLREAGRARFSAHEEAVRFTRPD